MFSADGIPFLQRAKSRGMDTQLFLRYYGYTYLFIRTTRRVDPTMLILCRASLDFLAGLLIWIL